MARYLSLEKDLAQGNYKKKLSFNPCPSFIDQGIPLARVHGEFELKGLRAYVAGLAGHGSELDFFHVPDIDIVNGCVIVFYYFFIGRSPDVHPSGVLFPYLPWCLLAHLWLVGEGQFRADHKLA